MRNVNLSKKKYGGNTVKNSNNTEISAKRPLFQKISDKKVFWVIIGLCAVCYFAFLKIRALWDPGESRYALISLEMLKNHNWLVPTLNEVKYFEKPPLAYWLNSVSMWLFGINELGARFVTAASALFTVGGTYLFTKQVIDRKTAVLSSAVLFTSIGFFAYSQICELDMLFTSFMCFGLWFLFANFEKGKRRAIPIHIGYVMLALACLVKGPIAFALPFLIIVIYLTLTKQWNRWRRLYPFTGIALAIIISAPWFIAISLKEPEFFKYFFLREHLQRFLSTAHHRTGQWWYFLPVIMAAFIPWIIVFFNSLKKILTDRNNIKPHIKKTFIYLAVWVITGMLIFSVSGSKRPPYILPLLPPLAILIGYYFAALWHSKIKLKKTLAVFVFVNLIIASALFKLPMFLQKYASDINISTTLPVILTIILFIAAAIIFKKSYPKKVFILMFLFATLFNIAIYTQTPNLNDIFSRKKISEIITRKDEGKIYTYHSKFERNGQSLGFYTNQRIHIVGGKGELALGAELSKEKDKYFPTEEIFLNELKTQNKVYAMVRKEHIDILKNKIQKKLYILKPKGKFALVSNYPLTVEK